MNKKILIGIGATLIGGGIGLFIQEIRIRKLKNKIIRAETAIDVLDNVTEVFEDMLGDFMDDPHLTIKIEQEERKHYREPISYAEKYRDRT